MQAAVIHRYGKNDRVQIEEVAKPEPSANDLLVSVRAASVNPVDFKIREGALCLNDPVRAHVCLATFQVTDFPPGRTSQKPPPAQ